jgi:SH3-like domain-containing protein
MRSIPLAAGLALALALGGRLSADPVLYNATVTAAEAEVRCGPSPDAKFYLTNRLPKGATVQVLKDRGDGWLEIRPPEGSFSWVNTRCVSQLVPSQPLNFTVEYDKTPVYIGSELTQTEPTVMGTSLDRSTQVHCFQRAGQPSKQWTDARGVVWMQIDPPAREVRYIQATALAKAAAPTLASDAPPGAPVPIPGAAGPAGPAAAGTAAPAATAELPKHMDVDELYRKAVEADRAGQHAEAIKLYTKVAYLGAQINHERVPDALRRASELMSPAPAPGAADSRLRPVAAEAPMPSPARLNAPYPATTTSASPIASQVGATYTTSRQTSPAATSTAPQFTGLLRKAGRSKNGLATYVLESDSWARCYVNGAPGVNLEPYLNKNVELIGTSSYDGEMRANYIYATQVRPLQ